MPTILIKGVSDDLLKELRRLKVELGCKTWAELLAKLVASKELIVLDEKSLGEMTKGIKGFLSLRRVVSEKWTGAPSVLEEVRKARRHEDS
ncbi:MAG: hypothetical protein ACUVUS_10035 [Thermoproteota archaeon]